MEVERLVVRLIADASQYTRVLTAAEARLTFFASAVAASVVSQTVTIAKDYERAAVAFEVLTGSAERARTVLNDISKMALETPFHSSELTDRARQLKAFNFATEEIIPTLNALGEVSSGTGTSLDRIVLAYGQVKVAGRLLGTELRQFTDAGIPLIESLAKVLGKPPEMIRYMVYHGQIGFPQVVKAFNEMTKAGGLFGGMMDRVNKETVHGRWENLSETFQVASRNVGLAFFKGFGLGDAMSGLTKSMGGVTGSAGPPEQLVRMFERWRGAFDAVVASGKSVVRMIGELIDWTRKQVTAVGEWIERHQALVMTLLTTVTVVGTVGITFRGLALAIGLVTGAVHLLTTAVRVLTGWTAIRFVILSIVSAATSLLPVLPGVVALTVAVAALGYALSELGAFDNLGQHMARGFTGLKGVVAETVAGIKAALESGDIGSAMDVALAGVKLGFRTMFVSLRLEWDQFLTDLAKGMDEFVVNKVLYAARMTAFHIRQITNPSDAAKNVMNRDAGLQRDQVWLRTRATEWDRKMTAQVEGLNRPLQDATREIERMTRALRLRAEADERARRWTKLLGEENEGYLGKLLSGSGPTVTTDRGFGGVLGGFGIVGRDYQQRMFLEKEVGERYFALEKAVGKGNTPLAESLAKDLNKSLSEYIREFDPKANLDRQMAAGFTIHPKAMEFAQNLTTEMEKGLTPMDRYRNSVKHLNEAFQGKFPGAVGGLVGRLLGGGSVIDRETYEVGLGRAFTELQRTRQARQEVLPTAANRWSAEAAEVINRQRNQSRTTEQEVLETIKGQLTEEKAQSEYLREVVRILQARGFGLGVDGRIAPVEVAPAPREVIAMDVP